MARVSGFVVSLTVALGPLMAIQLRAVPPNTEGTIGKKQILARVIGIQKEKCG